MPAPGDTPLHSLDESLDRLRRAAVPRPEVGWVRTLREALELTQSEVGRRLGLPRQGIAALEQREARGAVTLATLRAAAEALDAELVYALVPRRSLRRTMEERVVTPAPPPVAALPVPLPRTVTPPPMHRPAPDAT